jgi:hypothetical protein
MNICLVRLVGGWYRFVVREKFYWLEADKSNQQKFIQHEVCTNKKNSCEYVHTSSDRPSLPKRRIMHILLVNDMYTEMTSENITKFVFINIMWNFEVSTSKRNSKQRRSRGRLLLVVRTILSDNFPIIYINFINIFEWILQIFLPFSSQPWIAEQPQQPVSNSFREYLESLLTTGGMLRTN